MPKLEKTTAMMVLINHMIVMVMLYVWMVVQAAFMLLKIPAAPEVSNEVAGHLSWYFYCTLLSANGCLGRVLLVYLGKLGRFLLQCARVPPR